MKKTMKTVKTTLMALALATTTACDRIGGRDYAADRADARYQAAMAEYKAGNLKGAIAKLESAIKANPQNASVRFMLATIQQEKKEYFKAMCNFQEFMLLDPNGDKFDQAKARMAICEEMAANELLKNTQAVSNAPIIRENEKLKAEVDKLNKQNAALVKQNTSLKGRVKSLEEVNNQMRESIKAIGKDENPAAKPVPVAKDELSNILDSTDDKTAAPTTEGATHAHALSGDSSASPDLGLDAARALLDDADSTPDWDIADARRLAEDADREPDSIPDISVPAGSTPQPLVSTFGDLKSSSEPKTKNTPMETYVVQEGETLYQLAERFYGKRSAWVKIRDANKTTVTTDGRVRAGQRLMIPKEGIKKPTAKKPATR